MNQELFFKLKLAGGILASTFFLVGGFIFFYNKSIAPSKTAETVRNIYSKPVVKGTQTQSEEISSGKDKELAKENVSLERINVVENQIKLFEKKLKEAETSISAQSRYINRLISSEPLNESSSVLSLPSIIQQQKGNVVLVVCIDFEDLYSVSYGSGVVIGRNDDNDLVVLTNHHVVEDLEEVDSEDASCLIVAEGGEEKEGYLVQPYNPDDISEDDMEEIDFAFLTVLDEPIDISEEDRDEEDIPNTFLSLNTFPTFCVEGQLTIGEELVVLGYPSYSGDYDTDFAPVLTATEGIISEETDETDYYFNTSAKIERGNSGGGAFLTRSGCYAGIPTYGVVGEVESLGRILNADRLYDEYLEDIISSK